MERVAKGYLKTRRSRCVSVWNTVRREHPHMRPQAHRKELIFLLGRDEMQLVLVHVIRDYLLYWPFR
jgi:hypothetical protein